MHKNYRHSKGLFPWWLWLFLQTNWVKQRFWCLVFCFSKLIVKNQPWFCSHCAMKTKQTPIFLVQKPNTIHSACQCKVCEVLSNKGSVLMWSKLWNQSITYYHISLISRARSKTWSLQYHKALRLLCNSRFLILWSCRSPKGIGSEDLDSIWIRGILRFLCLSLSAVRTEESFDLSLAKIGKCA